jgi:carbamoyl-phosphate synthase large subunit
MLSNDRTKKPIILVSAVGGDIGAAIVRSLIDFEGTIIGCDMSRNASIREPLHKFILVPSADDFLNYKNTLLDIIKQEKVDFFFAVSEPEIKTVNVFREELEKHGVKLLLNNSLIVNTFLDKYETVRYLKRLNIRVPRTVLLEEYNGDFDFPFIVKSRFGSGSKTFRNVEDEIDLEYLKKKKNVHQIAQECIGHSDQEYTTGIFSDGTSVSSITFKRRLGFGGVSVEAKLVKEPFLENLAETIAKATGLKGSINLQSRRVDDIFIPFEINPRISSTLLFRKRFGFDDSIWWLNILSGKGYSYKPKYKSGVAVRYLREAYYDLEKV